MVKIYLLPDLLLRTRPTASIAIRWKGSWHGDHLCLPHVAPALAIPADLASLAVACHLFEDSKLVVALEGFSLMSCWCQGDQQLGDHDQVEDELLTLLWQH